MTFFHPCLVAPNRLHTSVVSPDPEAGANPFAYLLLCGVCEIASAHGGREGEKKNVRAAAWEMISVYVNPFKSSFFLTTEK